MRSICLSNLFKETPINLPEKFEVKLTPDEDQLCTLLDECRAHLAAKGQNVECRISGGWVRDKVCLWPSKSWCIGKLKTVARSFSERRVMTSISLWRI